ncbi:MAG: hypothetical protein KDN20_22910 [Verrucomicrobiae bacterium]|nr:hypothetical protein [Verrucomicrobiae bacterium]
MKSSLLPLAFVLFSLVGFPDLSPAEDLSSLGIEPEIAKARASGFRLQVTNTNDDGPGSLRQAIADAVHGGGPHGTVISFHRRLNGGSIELTSGQLEAPDDAPPIEISAADLPDGITIDAGGLSRVFYFGWATHIRLQGIIVKGGQAPDGDINSSVQGNQKGESGGGIFGKGESLTIVDCEVIENRAGDGQSEGHSQTTGASGGDGGGLYLAGPIAPAKLRIYQSEFSGNRAGMGAKGGGVGTTIDGGTGGNGGGIHVSGTSIRPLDVIIEDVLVRNNHAGDGATGFRGGDGGAGGRAGGIYVDYGFGLIRTSTVAENQSGTGAAGNLFSTLEGDGGDGGNGAGIVVGNNGHYALENVTIVSNRAGNGGARAGSTAISGDGGTGGGIYGEAPISVMHGTITDNEVGAAGGTDASDGVGGGWVSEQAGNTLTNSLLAENTGSLNYDGPTLTRSNSLFNGTIDLAPLGDYGGPTPTMPPMLGSPAIDVASSRLRIPADQRGVSRRGREHDAGAVELDALLKARLALDGGAPHFEVTRPENSGPGSLRDALEKAAAETALGAEHVVITFSPKLRGRTITLRSGALEATNASGAIHVVAAAKAREGNFLTAIDGIGLTANYRSRILETTAGGTLAIAGLKMMRGEAANGGGIFNEGNLFLEDCVVSDCRTSPGRGANGGGLYNAGGTMTLTGCRISGNVAATPASGDAGSGGGIYSDGDLIVTESTICENRAGGLDGVTDQGGSGGGIFSETGLVSVIGSTISSNRAGSGGSGGNGGGIAAVGGLGSVVIYNSTIAENTTGDGRAVAGIGGAVYAESGRTCSATGSTIADNVAVRGGLANTSKGGGIYAEGAFYLTNSILAQNKAATGANYINGVDSETPNQNNDSILGGIGIVLPLGDYGGPTQTMPPRVGSPALGIADPFEGPSVDQQGTFRDQGEPADAGAVEMDESLDHFITRAIENGPDAVDAWTDVRFEDWGEGGAYTGLIRDASGDVIGSISARVSSNGVVSGNLVVGNPSIRGRFRGSMAADGSFSATFFHQGAEYEVNLQLQENDDAPSKTVVLQLGGTLEATGGGPVYDLSIQGQRFHPFANPYLHPGRFTFVIPAIAGTETPSGDGYGTMSIDPAGRVRLMGTLGDGTRFAQASTMSGLETFPVFRALYRSNPRGSIGGLVRFLSEAQGVNYEGTLSWTKPADARESLYPDGFDTDCDFVASHYDQPPGGKAILPDILTHVPANAIWKLGGGGKAMLPEDICLAWDERNRVTAETGAGEILRIRANVRTGLVSGIYVNRNNRTRIPFGGAVLQPQGVITGCFAGEGESGFMLICANGVPEIEVAGLDSGDLVTFADAGIDHGFSEKRFVVRNIGTATLWSREGIAVLGQAPGPMAPAGPFQPVGNGRFALAPGQVALLTVRFSPQQVGGHTDTAEIRTNDPDLPVFSLDLQGDGVAGDEENDVTYRDWDGAPDDLFDLPTLFDIGAGTFDPAIHGAAYEGIVTENGIPAGKAVIRVNPRNGAFSGFVQLPSGRHGLRGRFDEDGRVNDNTNRFGTYELQILESPSDFFIEGFAVTGGTDPASRRTYDFLLMRPGFHPVRNPASARGLNGRYTFLMPPAEGRADNAPLGSGFGQAIVDKGGRVRALVTMGDGTRFAHTGFLTFEERWPIFQPLYGGRSGGHVAGEIQFRDLAGISDFDGELSWVKPPNSRERKYPEGFTIRQVVIGSTYEPPAPGENALTLLPEERVLGWGFLGGDLLLLDRAMNVKVQPSHRIDQLTSDPDFVFSGRVNPRTGQVAGVVRDRQGRLLLRYEAMIHQKQGLVFGLFHGRNLVGGIETGPAL